MVLWILSHGAGGGSTAWGFAGADRQHILELTGTAAGCRTERKRYDRIGYP